MPAPDPGIQEKKPAPKNALLEALTDYYLRTLQAPMPTPPPHPPAQMTPLQAVAAARNPQFAPMIQQQAAAPGIAQYGQEQMAFEQAMGARTEALRGAGGLAEAQMRMTSRQATPYGRLMVVQADEQDAAELGVPPGTPLVRSFERDPMTGSYSRGQVLAYGADAIRILEGQGGERFGVSTNTLQPRQIGQTRNLPSISGQPQVPAARVPPLAQAPALSPQVSPPQAPPSPVARPPLGGGTADKLRAPAATGEYGQAGGGVVLLSMLDQFERDASAFAATSPSVGKTAALEIGRSVLPGQAGVMLSEAQSPEMEVMAANRNRVARFIATQREPGRLSDFDIETAQREMPTVTSLTTEEGRRSFFGKMQRVRQVVLTGMLRQSRVRPNAFTPEERAKILLEAIKLGIQ